MAYISPSNRKFLIAYLLLVGLPLLGLAGILKAGRTLSTSISVDGNWKFETDPAKLAALPCMQSFTSLQDSVVNISQSGKELVLLRDQGGKTAGSGVIEDTTVTAMLPQPVASLGEGACQSNGLRLLATVDPKAKPKSMVATVSLNGCASCTAIEFRAVRQVNPGKKEAH